MPSNWVQLPMSYNLSLESPVTKLTFDRIGKLVNIMGSYFPKLLCDLPVNCDYIRFSCFAPLECLLGLCRS